MLNTILKFGVLAGLVVGVSLSVVVLTMHQSGGWGMAIGYSIMLVGLSAIFVAIKQRRDVEGGGVIRFWPAFGLGLGISVIASIIYVIAWESACAMAGLDFAKAYGDQLIAAERAKGAAGDVAKVTREMAEFRTQYANPLFRWPMTFAEIFPVGILVSLISAGLLRNPRFLPAKRV